MSASVKILFKGTIPGVGFTSSGQAKQNKTVVVARIETLNVQSGAEVIPVSSFGVETVDFIALQVVSASGCPYRISNYKRNC